MMSWNTIGFFFRSAVSTPMLSDLRLKAFGSGKPSGFTSFMSSNLTRALVVPKLVTTSDVSSNAPAPMTARTFLTVSLSTTTFVSLFSFFSFFGPSFSLTAARMRSMLLEPCASST